MVIKKKTLSKKIISAFLISGNLFQSFGNLFNDLNDSDSDEGTPSTSTTSTHRMETEDLD